MTRKQGYLLFHLDQMRNLYLFRGYGKDALLLSVLTHNGVPKLQLRHIQTSEEAHLRKIEHGDRNI